MQQASTSERVVRNETFVERKGDRELVVTRTFEAPARIVFDAWTKPEFLKRWWAPKAFGVSLFACEQDLRVGGTYRYTFGRDRENPEVFSGRYLVVDPPSRLVHTQIYERMAHAGEANVTVTLRKMRGDSTYAAPGFPEQGSAGRRAGLGDGERNADDARSARRTGRLDALMASAARRVPPFNDSRCRRAPCRGTPNRTSRCT